MAANVEMSDARLQIHFDVHNPIELVELTLSLQALAYEYQSFLSDQLSRQGKNVKKGEIKLYVSEIKNNCILAELAGTASVLGSFVPLMNYTNIFTDFVKNFKSVYEYFIAIGKLGKFSDNLDDVPYPKNQIDRVAEISKIVGKNKDGNLGLRSIKYEEEDKMTLFEVTFTSEEAFNAEKGAMLVKHALESRSDADHEKVVMQFFQTNLADPKADGKTGDRAIINRITSKDLATYFLSEIDRERIRNVIHDKGVNPLKLNFVVDVNVEVNRNQIPLAYRVVRLHDIIQDED